MNKSHAESVQHKTPNDLLPLQTRPLRQIESFSDERSGVGRNDEIHVILKPVSDYIAS